MGIIPDQILFPFSKKDRGADSWIRWKNTAQPRFCLGRRKGWGLEIWMLACGSSTYEHDCTLPLPRFSFTFSATANSTIDPSALFRSEWYLFFPCFMFYLEEEVLLALFFFFFCKKQSCLTKPCHGIFNSLAEYLFFFQRPVCLLPPFLFYSNYRNGWLDDVGVSLECLLSSSLSIAKNLAWSGRWCGSLSQCCRSYNPRLNWDLCQNFTSLFSPTLWKKSFSDEVCGWHILSLFLRSPFCSVFHFCPLSLIPNKTFSMGFLHNKLVHLFPFQICPVPMAK